MRESAGFFLANERILLNGPLPGVEVPTFVFLFGGSPPLSVSVLGSVVFPVLLVSGARYPCIFGGFNALISVLVLLPV